MALLVPTDQEVGFGGKLYYMPLSKDTFVHFTPARRAVEILASGKLLMSPPYKKMGIDAVAAVSTTWGWSTPKVQTTHIKSAPGEGPPMAIVFKTATMPDTAYVEEVLWHRDVALSGARLVSASKGASLLRNTPERLPDDQDQVSYDRSAMKTAEEVVQRFLSARRIAARWAAFPMSPAVLGVEIHQTDHGKGLFATKDFPRGQTLFQMTGPLVDREDRPNFQVGANTWMGTMGPALDSVNHSCGEPNCATLVEQPGRPVIAIEDIAAGDEITADYSVTSTSPSDGRFECHCESATCRGQGGGGWHSIPADQQQRYLALGIVPSYVA